MNTGAGLISIFRNPSRIIQNKLRYNAYNVNKQYSIFETQTDMDRNDCVIFAELNRERFDEILQIVMEHFKDLQYGRQGDDWIWIHLGNDKLEIDSFYSLNLEVKGRYEHLPIVRQIIQELKDDWILQIFDPPKIDITR